MLVRLWLDDHIAWVLLGAVAVSLVLNVCLIFQDREMAELKELSESQHADAATARDERVGEIRQLLQAISVHRQSRGETPIDVERETTILAALAEFNPAVLLQFESSTSAGPYLVGTDILIARRRVRR